METPNPYRTPATDLGHLAGDGNDMSPPYSPSGRFGRLSYIAWLAIVSVIGQLINLILVGGPPIELPVDPSGAPVPGAIPDVNPIALSVSLVTGLVVMVLGIIFAIRRCHDADISGWWNLIFLIPLVNLIYLLFLMIKRGSDGPNRFGPERLTPGWEKVVGIAGILLFVGFFALLIVAAIAMPAFMSDMGTAGPAGM
jgi:uncharacterized membrane protein YhaH (DUF805 family)